MSALALTPRRGTSLQELRGEKGRQRAWRTGNWYFCNVAAEEENENTAKFKKALVTSLGTCPGGAGASL